MKLRIHNATPCVLKAGTESNWAGASDRPFNFSTLYRWKSADTLDLTVFFTPQTNLDKFELFLGSYFQKFPKARTYLQDAGNGSAGFVESAKDKAGEMQFFPKGAQVLPMINDGRWTFPPYPQHVAIRPTLAAPLGMKVQPESGVTVLVMSPPEDCFAVSMAQQGAEANALYLSLFGKDVKQGQTLTGHARLVFGRNMSDAQALQRYADYLQDVENQRDDALMSRAEMESLRGFCAAPITPVKMDWISPQAPKPGADGWVVLFDGKQLYDCSPPVADVESGKLSVQDGCLRLDSGNLGFNPSGRDVVMRAHVKKVSGQNCHLAVRVGDHLSCLAWFNGRDFFGIGKVVDGRYRDLATGFARESYKEFFEMEFRAEGKKLTLNADGQKICEAWDDSVVEGAVGIQALKGITLFKSLEVRMLNGAPAADASLEPPEDVPQGLILHYDFDTEPVGGKISDKSGRGNDGTAVGAQWVADGHQGGGISFGLNNSYITVPNNEEINPRHLTMAAWIKTSYKDQVWRRIFDKGTGKGYVLSMCGDDKGKSFRGEVDVEPGRTWAHSGIQVADGQWHHVAGTYDGADAKIYVDGWPVGPSGHWAGMLAHTPYDLTIGANRSNPGAGEAGPSFNGMMDDVMMFNRALSAGEVQALFKSQGGVLAPQPAQPPPVAGTQSKPDAAVRLKQVKQLLDQGLINKEDYDRKVKEILDSI